MIVRKSKKKKKKGERVGKEVITLGFFRQLTIDNLCERHKWIVKSCKRKGKLEQINQSTQSSDLSEIVCNNTIFHFTS